LDPLIKSQLLYQLSYAPIEVAEPTQPARSRHVAKARQAVQPNSDGSPLAFIAANRGQFFALSTSLFLPIQGIIARNFAPTSSIG
jgi:hypothetical protein